MEPIKNENHSSENIDSSLRSPDAESAAETTYSTPKIFEVGSVEELTHGSREQTADDGSGYQGG